MTATVEFTRQGFAPAEPSSQWNDVLCRLVGQLPAGKNQHAGMALEGPGENLGTFDTQTDSVILNGRNSGLGNPSKTSQLTLAQLLKLTKNAYGLADRNRDTPTPLPFFL